MAAEHLQQSSIDAHSTQPLVGVFVDDTSDVVRYLVDEPTDAPAQPSADAQAALAAIGTWSDLDWEELAEDLDRVRHASPPTPPIDLDDL